VVSVKLGHWLGKRERDFWFRGYRFCEGGATCGVADEIFSISRLFLLYMGEYLEN